MIDLKQLLKGLSLFYGTTILLTGIGMALYMLLAENPIPAPAGTDIDLRTFYLAVALPMNVAMGLFLIWAGLSPGMRRRMWRELQRMLRD
ncbi:MAG: hypothetical protein KY476_17725 [Planctomycetes bacterium]|nr:hypothetical protein [Planctomycetota bacterium]